MNETTDKHVLPYLSTIPTTDLVTELKNRHELCPVVDEMTREPVCLCVMTTESLVKELSKRNGVGYHIIRNSFEIKRGTCESPKLESHWQEVKYDGPITVLVVRE